MIPQSSYLKLWLLIKPVQSYILRRSLYVLNSTWELIYGLGVLRVLGWAFSMARDSLNLKP